MYRLPVMPLTDFSVKVAEQTRSSALGKAEERKSHRRGLETEGYLSVSSKCLLKGEERAPARVRVWIGDLKCLMTGETQWR